MEKGLLNYFYHCFTDESIKLKVELEHIISLNVAFVHDDISDIVDIGWADLCYEFDAENFPVVNRHMTMVWNDKRSKNCKFTLQKQ